jgi:hypothetical protein
MKLAVGFLGSSTLAASTASTPYALWQKPAGGISICSPAVIVKSNFTPTPPPPPPHPPTPPPTTTHTYPTGTPYRWVLPYLHPPPPTLPHPRPAWHTRPAGLFARQELATGLRKTGHVMATAMALLSVPDGVGGSRGGIVGQPRVHPEDKLEDGSYSGRATGDLKEGGEGEGEGDEQGGGFGGFPQAQAEARAAGGNFQGALVHIEAARWEWDVYRPTHRLPPQPFLLLSILGRATLSAVAMLLYSQQLGGSPPQRAACRRLASQLLAAARAFQGCCGAVAAALETNQPMLGVLRGLEELGASVRALEHAARAAPAEREGGQMAPDFLALDLATSLAATASVRVRRRRLVL